MGGAVLVRRDKIGPSERRMRRSCPAMPLEPRIQGNVVILEVVESARLMAWRGGVLVVVAPRP